MYLTQRETLPNFWKKKIMLIMANYWKLNDNNLNENKSELLNQIVNVKNSLGEILLMKL